MENALLVFFKSSNGKLSVCAYIIYRGCCMLQCTMTYHFWHAQSSSQGKQANFMVLIRLSGLHTLIILVRMSKTICANQKGTMLVKRAYRMSGNGLCFYFLFLVVFFFFLVAKGVLLLLGNTSTHYQLLISFMLTNYMELPTAAMFRKLKTISTVINSSVLTSPFLIQR